MPRRAKYGTRRSASAKVKPLWNCSRMVARGVIVRSRKVLSRAPHLAARSSNSDAGWASRRRQFGCSSIVPGRFGCSARPRMSSSGISASARRRLRREGDRRIDRRSGIVRRFAVRNARLPERGPERGAILRALLRSRPFRRPEPMALRVAMSAPFHQPATVGRSCVVVIATASRRHSAGGMNDIAVALEPEHVHAGDAGARKPRAEFRLAPCRDPRR